MKDVSHRVRQGAGLSSVHIKIAFIWAKLKVHDDDEDDEAIIHILNRIFPLPMPPPQGHHGEKKEINFGI